MKKNTVVSKPKVSEFPIYCFDVSVKKNDIFISIPIEMRMNGKKYNAVNKEMRKFLKPYGYEESGSGTGLDGFYDIHYVREVK